MEKKKVQLANYKSAFQVIDARDIIEHGISVVDKALKEVTQNVIHELMYQILGKDYAKSDIERLSFSRSPFSLMHPFVDKSNPVTVCFDNMKIGSLEIQSKFAENEYRCTGYCYSILFHPLQQFNH